MKTKCVDLPSLRRAMRLSLGMSVLAVACALAVTSVVAQTARKHATSPPNGKRNKAQLG
jgi:hypothetical protein